MTDLIEYLQRAGCEISQLSDNHFHASCQAADGATLTLLRRKNTMMGQVDFQGMTYSILSESYIESVSELHFILSRNVALQQEFPRFMQAISQDQSE